MLQRLSVAGLVAIAIALAAARPHAAPARPSDEDGFEVWSDCRNLPDSFEFLPLYLASEPQGFVDLGQNETVGPQAFRKLQYTRDKDFGQWPIRTGRWYGTRMGLSQWPLRTVDATRVLEQFRVTAWQIDGAAFPVDPTCIQAVETDDLAMAWYNTWVRFSTPGTHTLKIFAKQIGPFLFTDPLSPAGLDPFGLDGRRMFVKEEVGDLLDAQFVHSYELIVGREDATATNNLQLATNR
jgi:hypothetical protein